MSRRVQGWIDKDGEVREDLSPLLITEKRPNDFKEWFQMSQTALKDLRSLGLQAKDYEVLFCMLERLDFENYIQVKQSDIADELGMKVQNVSRSVRKLIREGVILHGPKNGQTWTYRLNPGFGWKGRGSNHSRAIKQGFEVIEGGKSS